MSNSISSFTPISPSVFAEYTSRPDQNFSIMPSTQRALDLLVDLVGSSSLSNKKLKIFDAGCNRGHLVDAFERKKLKNRIARYIGMDFVVAILDHARAEAPKRFGQISYEFRHGDIINPESFKGIKRDNNLINCSAVAGHLTPAQLKLTIENLGSTMSPDSDSRMFIGIAKSNFVPNGFKEEVEDNIRVVKYILEGYVFRAFHPEDLTKFFSSLDLFQVDEQSSYFGHPSQIARMFNPAEDMVICLKRKS